jgi:hypothetical protein
VRGEGCGWEGRRGQGVRVPEWYGRGGIGWLSHSSFGGDEEDEGE